jgi:hypothetical protein
MQDQMRRLFIFGNQSDLFGHEYVAGKKHPVKQRLSTAFAFYRKGTQIVFGFLTKGHGFSPPLRVFKNK